MQPNNIYILNSISQVSFYIFLWQHLLTRDGPELTRSRPQLSDEESALLVTESPKISLPAVCCCGIPAKFTSLTPEPPPSLTHSPTLPLKSSNSSSRRSGIREKTLLQLQPLPLGSPHPHPPAERPFSHQHAPGARRPAVAKQTVPRSSSPVPLAHLLSSPPPFGCFGLLFNSSCASTVTLCMRFVHEKQKERPWIRQKMCIFEDKNKNNSVQTLCKY